MAIQRYGMAVRLKDEKRQYYIDNHANVWPEVLEELKKINVQNYSIFLKEDFMFGYLEYTGNDFDGDIKKSDILDKNNKYNTYMINGLPPSPIAVSSLSSIKSVYEGVPSDYLFFVADSKTSHYFSKTYKEHLNKIKELGLDKWK